MVEDGGAESGERSEVAIEREREREREREIPEVQVFLCKVVWMGVFLCHRVSEQPMGLSQ
jgi:hypothetical protein